MVKIKCSLKSWWRNSFCSLLKKKRKKNLLLWPNWAHLKESNQTKLSTHNNSFDWASYIEFTYVSLYMTMFGEVYNTNSFGGGGVRVGGDICQKGQQKLI